LVGGREKARPQTLAESFIRSIRCDRLRQRRAKIDRFCYPAVTLEAA